jgi:serpin B
VNEEGTEAAAATSVGISFTSIGDNYFYVNKPFLCVVKERNTNAILFIGKIVNPLN